MTNGILVGKRELRNTFAGMDERVFIGLGSNMGDREARLKQAIADLKRRAGAVVQESSVIETAPWGFEAEQHFLNQVLELRTPLEPLPLMKELLDIESDMGRIRSEEPRYSSRPIDLDLLFYGDRVINLLELKVPHPLLEEREFVLKPMAEIAPDFIHPTDGHTMEELLDRLISTKQPG